MQYERYDLEKDFREAHNLYKIENPFPINSIKFWTDSILELMGRTEFTKIRELNYKNLTSEEIEILKSLGYIK